jgi:hypothetical protein
MESLMTNSLIQSALNIASTYTDSTHYEVPNYFFGMSGIYKNVIVVKVPRISEGEMNHPMVSEICQFARTNKDAKGRKLRVRDCSKNYGKDSHLKVITISLGY